MGNRVALCKPSIGSCIGAVMAKHEKVLQVVKADGKVLEFKTPTLVKDILVNFSGSAGIGVSREASVHLPLNYELKKGKIYYILPSLDSGSGTVSPAPAANSSMVDSEEADGVKRIKVVITKQQLKQLLSKQISLEELLPGLKKTSSCSVDSPTNWKPKLESIPEGSE